MNSTQDMTGRTAVVTGGGSGIGLATAKRLAQQGVRVFAGDLRYRPDAEEQLQVLRVERLTCDVRNLPQLQQLIDTAAQSTGRLDILVSNAGVVQVGQIDAISEAQWDRVLDTNLKACFFGAKFALPHLRRNGGGCIVHTASNAGLLPRAHDPVYSISKQAVVGLTKSLALSHAPDRIRVNCVCPGPVCDTDIMNDGLTEATNAQAAAQAVIDASPLAQAHGRMVTPDEVAEAIVYLVSDAAAMVTGTAIAIDGGKSLGVPARQSMPPRR